MKIDMIKVSVREIVKGYSEDDATSRVVAWDGKYVGEDLLNQEEYNKYLDFFDKL